MTTPEDQAQQRRTADAVMYWVRRRGLTRQVFADRLGKSVSWVDKIGNGDRQLDRGSAARRVAHALSATAQNGDAVELVRSAADRPSPHLATAGPAFVSAYGMLLLKGSIAAAQLYRAADVRDLQAEALGVATGYLQWTNEMRPRRLCWRPTGSRRRKCAVGPSRSGSSPISCAATLAGPACRPA